jgi:hypothetical protein
MSNEKYSYRRLRRAIGYLGMGLPVLLIIFSLIPFFETDFQKSISHYYYTNLREFFTGILCAVGLFMIRYKGKSNSNYLKNENFLTNLAGIMAVCVAFIPVNPDYTWMKKYTLIPYNWEMIGGVHYLSAALLFLIFSLLAINVFTEGQRAESSLSRSSFNENNIYRFCGYTILGAVILVPVSSHFNWFTYSTFLLEMIALILFGTAWLIKGRALGDAGVIGETLYGERNPENTEQG